jgi:hypothetical protein
MPNDSAIPMRERFAEWYRDVSLGQDVERVDRRWEGVCTLAAKADKSYVDSLIAHAFGGLVSAEFLGEMLGHFADANDGSVQDRSERELQILSGSALALALDGKGEIAAYAALAITTANMTGVRIYDLPMNLPAMADYALVRISEMNRVRPNASSISQTLPPLNFAEAKAKLEEQPNTNGMAAAFELFATAVTQAFDVLSNELHATSQKNQGFFAAQDEELNLLWWIIGGYSSDLDKFFEDVPLNAQPLTFGKELAGLTTFLPGPPSIKAMLCRARLSTRVAITIPEAVNACSNDWLKALRNQHVQTSPLIEPIHTAIHRKVQGNDNDSWIPGWAAACNLDEDRTFSTADIGWLFYCECLIQQVKGMTQ